MEKLKYTKNDARLFILIGFVVGLMLGIAVGIDFNSTDVEILMTAMESVMDFTGKCTNSSHAQMQEVYNRFIMSLPEYSHCTNDSDWTFIIKVDDTLGVFLSYHLGKVRGYPPDSTRFKPNTGKNLEQ